MERLGKELDSASHWRQEAGPYGNAITNQYHRHRLAVIDALIPKELRAPGRRIFDFGCGDAVLFPQFLKAGAEITGVDITPEMINLGKQRLRKDGYDENRISLGDVSKMSQLSDDSHDAVISFNVLAYLTPAEERTFYQETGRILKKGGSLVVTHSNELFDMFSLNRYTVDFFRKNFISNDYAATLASLLTKSDVPENPIAYNVRENPLSYPHRLRAYGFEEIRQEFINQHVAPPPLLTGKDYPNTLGASAEERWKLMFTCSTYGSCSIKL